MSTHSLTHSFTDLADPHSQQRRTATATNRPATTVHSRSPVATEGGGSARGRQPQRQRRHSPSLLHLSTTRRKRASERAQQGRGGGGHVARGLRCWRERRVDCCCGALSFLPPPPSLGRLFPRPLALVSFVVRPSLSRSLCLSVYLSHCLSLSSSFSLTLRFGRRRRRRTKKAALSETALLGLGVLARSSVGVLCCGRSRPFSVLQHSSILPSFYNSCTIRPFLRLPRGGKTRGSEPTSDSHFGLFLIEATRIRGSRLMADFRLSHLMP